MVDILKDLNDFNYTDGVEDVMAVYVNNLLAATLRAEYRNVETISAKKTLIDADTPVQVLDADGSNQEVELPAESTDNHPFMVVNFGATYSLVVKNAGGTTIATVTPESAQLILSSGDGWWPMVTELIETSGPTALALGAIADGQVLKRSGTNIVGETITTLGGWNTGTGSWSYSSADAPTFVISVNNDQTGIICVGMRIKLTQTSDKYFIVTDVGAYSGGVTLITVYGGTDYTLTNAVITNPFYSNAKVPFGFPFLYSKWTEEFTDNTNAQQASPTANTWYNLHSKSIPIGNWLLGWQAAHYSTGNGSQYLTLSTANNSETDADFTQAALGLGINPVVVISPGKKDKYISLASKTTYYMLTKTGNTGMSSIGTAGTVEVTKIRAVCAYL